MGCSARFAVQETKAAGIVFSRSLVSIKQESLGGKVRIMVTGAAPISPPVLTFLRAAMGCLVSQAPFFFFFFNFLNLNFKLKKKFFLIFYYSVVLVSAVEQSALVIYIHVSPLLSFLFR